MSASLAALGMLLAVLTGCQLSKDTKDCASEPGEAGGGVSVCTRPAPTEFDPMK